MTGAESTRHMQAQVRILPCSEFLWKKEMFFYAF